MALSVLSARLGVSASRMIVKAVGGGGTGKASSFSRTLKVVSDSNGGVGRRGFGQIRRFSGGAMARLPEQITKDPSQQGVCYLAAYCAGLILCSAAPFGLKYIADRYAERRKPRYGEFRDDVRQFGDEYFGDQWPGADDRKLAELGKEIALLAGALNKWNRGIGELSVGLSRCDPQPEVARLRKQPLHHGTPDEAFEIRRKCDYVVEEKAVELSRWRASADEKLAELNREIAELLRTIRKENEL
ncbi:hypothetical protein ACQJBY_033580 [Aegilops geniculata]